MVHRRAPPSPVPLRRSYRSGVNGGTAPCRCFIATNDRFRTKRPSLAAAGRRGPGWRAMCSEVERSPRGGRSIARAHRRAPVGATRPELPLMQARAETVMAAPSTRFDGPFSPFRAVSPRWPGRRGPGSPTARLSLQRFLRTVAILLSHRGVSRATPWDRPGTAQRH